MKRENSGERQHLSAIAAEDTLQGRITLSGRQRRALSSSSSPLPPRQQEEITGRREQTSRSDWSRALLRELWTDPLISPILHHGGQARKESDSHQTLPVGVDVELQNGITPDNGISPNSSTRLATGTTAQTNLHILSRGAAQTPLPSPLQSPTQLLARTPTPSTISGTCSSAAGSRVGRPSPGRSTARRREGTTAAGA